MSADPLHILKTVYGYESFRERQADIIAHVASGGHAFVVMPTGGGKSLCYQIPALCRDGAGLIVSPLIALMEDQVSALVQAGVRAAALNSRLSGEERESIWRDLEAGALDLLYMAPETLLKPDTLSRLKTASLSLIAIDEAHCLSQWGHDFRPEYRALDRIVDLFPETPRIALTATADAPTRAEIVSHLKIGEGESFVSGFDRPNIRYSVAEKQNPTRQMLTFLNARKGESGIVYCLSKRRTEEVAATLSEHGFTALPYHAGMEMKDRETNQRRFQHEQGVVMAATIAFGMGIDKPDVRFVLHMDLPSSIEAYYQETGRAGRDGLPAEALMLYGAKDISLRRMFIDRSEAPDLRKRTEHGKLEALLGFAETSHCRRRALLNYFGDDCVPCGNCDACLDPPETFDGSIAAQKFLSCLHRTGERFGGAYVISVLLGEADDRIQRLGHDRISTFGIGKEHDRAQWRSIMRQLIALGLVSADVAGHGGLSIAPAGRRFLREKSMLNLRILKKVKREKRAKPAADLAPAEAGLFEELRRKRLELAQAQKLPPYVIFHDRTLQEMARRRPRAKPDFAALPGVGEAKLVRYGEAFLEVINAYQEGDADVSAPVEAPQSSPQDDGLSEVKQRHPRAYEKWSPAEDAELLDLHRQGTSVAGLAEYFRRQPSAIRSRLAKLPLSDGASPS